MIGRVSVEGYKSNRVSNCKWSIVGNKYECLGVFMAFYSGNNNIISSQLFYRLSDARVFKVVPKAVHIIFDTELWWQ